MFGHYKSFGACDFQAAGMTLVKLLDDIGQRPHDINVAFQYSNYIVAIPNWNNHPKHVSLYACIKTTIIQKNSSFAIIICRQPPIFVGVSKCGQFASGGNHDPITVGEKYFTIGAGHDYSL